MDKKTFSLFSFFLFFIFMATLVLATPQFKSETPKVANNTQYNPSRGVNAYGFSINITDNTGANQYAGIAEVLFENNFNGSTWNATGTNNTAGIFWINFTYKGNLTNANTLYSYKWYADNTTGGFDNTTSSTYYIAKNTSSIVCMNISVYAIGGILSDTCNANAQSYQGQGNPYADCWMGLVGSCGAEPSPSWGTTYLYRDEATWTKGSSGATSLSAASYTVKCNSTGNVNYTDNSTGSSYTLSILTSGGGGGGEPIPTTVPTTTQPWQPIGIPKGWNIDSKWIWIGVILLVIYAFSKKRRK